MKPAERPPGQPRPPYTFEDMMNQPCKMHSGVGKPASHTTRQCIWVERLAKGGAGNPPPPPPPPGPPPANARQQFPRHDAAYMIFTSESDDKGIRRAREQAVNATMPTISQMLNWSDNAITWERNAQPGQLYARGGCN